MKCKHKWEILSPSFEVCVVCKIARIWNHEIKQWEFRQGHRIDKKGSDKHG